MSADRQVSTKRRGFCSATASASSAPPLGQTVAQVVVGWPPWPRAGARRESRSGPPFDACVLLLCLWPQLVGSPVALFVPSPEPRCAKWAPPCEQPPPSFLGFRHCCSLQTRLVQSSRGEEPLSSEALPRHPIAPLIVHCLSSLSQSRPVTKRHATHKTQERRDSRARAHIYIYIAPHHTARRDDAHIAFCACESLCVPPARARDGSITAP